MRNRTAGMCIAWNKKQRRNKIANRLPEHLLKRFIIEKKIVIPGVFKAAGLMVPEPSIMSLPMPLIGVETE